MQAPSAATSFNIVPAREQDVAVILEMIRALAEHEKLSDHVIATEEKIRSTLFGESPAAEVLLAWRGHECLGFAVFFRSYSTFLAQPGIYLEDLYVKPHARGSGIGFALLCRIAAIARDRGCGRIEWGVLNWNEPSIRFYKALGAVPMDEWTKYRLTGEALQALAERGTTLPGSSEPR